MRRPSEPPPNARRGRTGAGRGGPRRPSPRRPPCASVRLLITSPRGPRPSRGIPRQLASLAPHGRPLCSQRPVCVRAGSRGGTRPSRCRGGGGWGVRGPGSAFAGACDLGPGPAPIPLWEGAQCLPEPRVLPGGVKRVSVTTLGALPQAAQVAAKQTNALGEKADRLGAGGPWPRFLTREVSRFAPSPGFGGRRPSDCAALRTAKSLPEPRNPAVRGTRALPWRREAAAVSLHGNWRGKFLVNRNRGHFQRALGSHQTRLPVSVQHRGDNICRNEA